MVDRSMAQPEGVLEDVLVKVGKFIFPVDFVVMKMEEDNQIPLLLGRPFLATRVALIDVQKGELTLRVGNEAVHFSLDKSMTESDVDAENCNVVDNSSVTLRNLYRYKLRKIIMIGIFIGRRYGNNDNSIRRYENNNDK